MGKIRGWFNSPLNEKTLPALVAVVYLAVVFIVVGFSLVLNLID